MKFFEINDLWFYSNDDYFARDITIDDERTAKLAYERYQQHLEGLQNILPVHVLTLARLQGVDDGLLIEVKHDRDQKIIELILRCGDIPKGYFDLTLTYIDAEISSDDEFALARIARTTINDGYHESDLNCYELDISEDGRIEHRILFHPGVWFAIKCRELNWRKIAQPDRRLPELKNRFPGYPIFNLVGISEITKQPYLAWNAICQGVECRVTWFGNISINEDEKQFYFRSVSWMNEYIWSLELYKQDSIRTHEHCLFCWQKIAEAEYGDPDSAQNAYVHRSSNEDGKVFIEWVCISCFKQLRETFRWRVASAGKTAS